MGSRVRNIPFLLWLLVAAPTLLRAEGEITLGVLPYVTAGQLVEYHTPLKNYIAENLGRPVALITAPDFLDFVERTSKSEYDLILTAPHFARLAERRDGYQVVVRSQNEIQAAFLVRKDSNIQRLEDLKGKRIMVAQPISMMYQLSIGALEKKGLVPGKNITIVEARTNNNALSAPLRNEAEAGVTGILLWGLATGENKEQLRLIATSPSMPGFVLMAHKRIPKKDVDKLRKALLSFRTTPPGEAYFAASGLKGFALTDSATMSSLDPYTRVLTQKH
jgi:phosphonate transport system substrate-binding protein